MAEQVSSESVYLVSDELAVTVDVGRGADIIGLVDQTSGVDVLFSLPRIGSRIQCVDGDSWREFHANYRGGWQLILPNGGDACNLGGSEFAFHGEAWRRPWQADGVSANSARLSVRLETAPLLVERRLEVNGRVLRIEEAVTNEASEPAAVMWSHHPAFGAPLLAAGARVYAGARRFMADFLAPGTFLAAGERFPWPFVTSTKGETVDLSVIPSPHEHRALLGYLTDFDRPFYALVNPALDLGVGLVWDQGLFAHAWLWQELSATPGFPWHGRAYVMAIEPATTIPGHGLAVSKDRGGRPLVLGPKQRRETVIEAVVFRDGRPVSAIEPGGRVVFIQE